MSKAAVTPREVTFFFLLLAGLAGGSLRLYPILINSFPLVDGGMFYAMIQDLLRDEAAHFSLPFFTAYNHAQIPFAYPPLGFYLGAALDWWTPLSALDVLRWLPVTVSLLNLPLYYGFARAVFPSAPKAALATLLFALTPASYWWNIVGGGLTRALGAFFFTAVLLTAYRALQTRSRAWLVASVLSLTGAILSHPAWALQSLAALAVMGFFLGRDRRGILSVLFITAGAALLASPWWATVIARHGADIFLLAAQGGYSRWRFWTVFFTLAFTDETIPMLAVLGILGMFIHLARRDFFLPAWIFLALFIEPRGGMPASVFAFSLLAASALTDGIAAAFSESRNWQASLSNFGGKAFFGFLVLLLSYHAFQVSSAVSMQVLTVEQRDAIQWIRANTPTGARFLLFDLESNPLHSPFTEWFPALAERRSIATIQGAEWLRGEENYAALYAPIFNIHACVYRDLTCVEERDDPLGEYDYIALTPSPLAESLRHSASFELAYESPHVLVFQRAP